MAIYMWREEETPTIIPLNFTAQEANSTVALNKNGTPTTVNLEVSTDGATWSDYTIGGAITLANVGDKVYWRNKSTTDTGFSTSDGMYYRFSMSGKIGASGDVTSLLNKNGTTTLSNYCFYGLFNGCTSLTTAPELQATTLTDNCYSYMFSGCTSLTTPPALPAMTLADYCYDYMFNGCTSLTTPPALPATTLALRCYEYMFQGCTSLTTLPELPATTLASYCYYNMFSGCTSLTILPELPATTLANSCYNEMFYGCTSIKVSTTQTGEYQIPYIIPTTGTGTTATYALRNMFLYTGGTFTGTPTINTTYYLRSGAVPVTTAGIYHNETEGLISLSSDGENWITIADKNLGATQVWNDGDELTQENCGGFFQRGNNYMFPRTGPVNTTTTQINASEYGPSNYYSSDTFFYGQEDWDSSVNNDLWGYTTGTNEARQGPCQSGFHVPVHTEFGDIWRILKSFNRGGASYWKSLLFMPNAGSISRTSGTYSSSSYITLWSCGSPQNAFDINTFSSNSVTQQSMTYLVAKRASGYAIRPFKNEPVVPTSERTVLYQPN